MTWLAILIILIVGCLSLAIFAPKNKSFYDRKIYPELELISDPMHMQLIRDDLKSLTPSSFINYPDEKMWKYNSTSSYEIFPFYMFGKFSRDNINTCPDTFKLAHNIPYIRSMAFIKIGAKSVLKVHQSWKNIANETFRCFIGVDVPICDVHMCGVWVEGNTKKLEDDKWLVFDASKKHSIYNKYKKDCYLLMFDLQRPGNSIGLSQKSLPDEIKNCITPTTDQGPGENPHSEYPEDSDDSRSKNHESGKSLQQLSETE
jgi:aspartyl/asparaginyl beta-hydroxylase (cupin superfamily)